MIVGVVKTMRRARLELPNPTHESRYTGTEWPLSNNVLLLWLLVTLQEIEAPVRNLLVRHVTSQIKRTL